ncbi:MAG: MiaB/RimO family radical SAM methylthiotransferase [Candidatus Margulisbacteria bacterium]|nr:MiaB/RimO family radical SAM methylthiotransferase [Candidatus Margulisiibacteriota bacterium]
MARTKTYLILTYGCQMNKNDSEHLAGMFEFQGLKPAENIEQANLVVLNTCSVREKSERKVFGKLHELNHLRKKKKLQMELGITGCMPKRDVEFIKQEVPFLDHFIDIDDARHYPLKRSHSDQAWVSIMYGCDNFCSYCVVPYTRGRERSRPVDDILKEIAEIDSTKFPRVMLLGQNVNSYKSHSPHKDGSRLTTHDSPFSIDFADLLKRVHKIDTVKEIEFLTSHPKDMTDKLIDTLAALPKMGTEVHFPLQAGNDRILKLMNRGYTYAHYKDLVVKTRKKMPQVKISTDIIAGFPSETESEFEDSLNAIRELKFSRVNTAAFSPRPGTKAAELPDQLPLKIRAQRLQQLMAVVDQTK